MKASTHWPLGCVMDYRRSAGACRAMALLLDLRTVFPRQESQILQAVFALSKNQAPAETPEES